MLRNIKDEDIRVGACVRMMPETDRFSDCIVVKVACDTVSLKRPYCTEDGNVDHERFVVSFINLKKAFKIHG